MKVNKGTSLSCGFLDLVQGNTYKEKLLCKTEKLKRVYVSVNNAGWDDSTSCSLRGCYKCKKMTVYVAGQFWHTVECSMLQYWNCWINRFIGMFQSCFIVGNIGGVVFYDCEVVSGIDNGCHSFSEMATAVTLDFRVYVPYTNDYIHFQLLSNFSFH